MEYYWGVPNTSIDFCEEKYIINPYIAEYYNVISSLSFILVGLPFIRSKMSNIAWVTILIGIGSMLLHGTLQQYGQWVDEMAMISLNFFAFKPFYSDFSILYLFIIIAMYYKNCDHYISFLGIFSIMHYFVWKEITERKYKINRLYYHAYHIFFIIGFMCWLSDQFLCNYIKPYQLHACWHVCSALSILFCMLGFNIHQHVQ